MIPVVRGEAAATRTQLLASGAVSWSPARPGRPDLGASLPSLTARSVTSPTREHGYLGIGPFGTALRRQLLQATRSGMVAD